MHNSPLAKKWLVYILAIIIFPPLFLVFVPLLFAATIESQLFWFAAIEIIGLVTIWWFAMELCNLLTQFLPTGISLFTLRGRVFVPYAAVTKYELTMTSVLISTQGRRYNLSLTFYKYPEQLITYLAQQTASEMSRIDSAA